MAKKSNTDKVIMWLDSKGGVHLDDSVYNELKKGAPKVEPTPISFVDTLKAQAESAKNDYIDSHNPNSKSFTKDEFIRALKRGYARALDERVTNVTNIKKDPSNVALDDFTKLAVQGHIQGNLPKDTYNKMLILGIDIQKKAKEQSLKQKINGRLGTYTSNFSSLSNEFNPQKIQAAKDAEAARLKDEQEKLRIEKNLQHMENMKKKREYHQQKYLALQAQRIQKQQDIANKNAYLAQLKSPSTLQDYVDIYGALSGKNQTLANSLNLKSTDIQNRNVWINGMTQLAKNQEGILNGKVPTKFDAMNALRRAAMQAKRKDPNNFAGSYMEHAYNSIMADQDYRDYVTKSVATRRQAQHDNIAKQRYNNAKSKSKAAQQSAFQQLEAEQQKKRARQKFLTDLLTGIGKLLKKNPIGDLIRAAILMFGKDHPKIAAFMLTLPQHLDAIKSILGAILAPKLLPRLGGLGSGALSFIAGSRGGFVRTAANAIMKVGKPFRGIPGADVVYRTGESMMRSSREGRVMRYLFDKRIYNPIANGPIFGGKLGGSGVGFMNTARASKGLLGAAARGTTFAARALGPIVTAADLLFTGYKSISAATQAKKGERTKAFFDNGGGGLIGGTAGAILGGVFGGPAGAALGGLIGKWVGNAIAKWGPKFIAGMTNIWQGFKTQHPILSKILTIVFPMLGVLQVIGKAVNWLKEKFGGKPSTKEQKDNYTQKDVYTGGNSTGGGSSTNQLQLTPEEKEKREKQYEKDLKYYNSVKDGGWNFFTGKDKHEAIKERYRQEWARNKMGPQMYDPNNEAAKLQMDMELAKLATSDEAKQYADDRLQRYLSTEDARLKRERDALNNAVLIKSNSPVAGNNPTYKTYRKNGYDSYAMSDLGLHGAIWANNSKPYIRKGNEGNLQALDNSLHDWGYNFIYTSAMGGHSTGGHVKGNKVDVQTQNGKVLTPEQYRALYKSGAFGGNTGAVGYEFDKSGNVTTPEMYEKMYKSGKVFMGGQNGNHYDFYVAQGNMAAELTKLKAQVGTGVSSAGTSSGTTSKMTSEGFSEDLLRVINATDKKMTDEKQNLIFSALDVSGSLGVWGITHLNNDGKMMVAK